jgi:predicted transcriptional regulator
MVRWSIWLNKETITALKKIGKQSQRPVGWLIRKAVEDFIKQRKRTK